MLAKSSNEFKGNIDKYVHMQVHITTNIHIATVLANIIYTQINIFIQLILSNTHYNT